MLNEKMYELGAHSSVIREIFEYGKARKAEIGEENVFDYSLGNPSVPAPKIVNETIKDLVDNMDSTLLHGYTSAVGDNDTRKAIAEYLNKTYATHFKFTNFYMTCGAAASLSITFRALAQEGDEVIFFAPFFPEYTVFAENAGLKPVIVPCDGETLQIDLEEFRKAISERTKAVVVNSPNNPSGVVLSVDTVKALVGILKEKEREFDHPIFLISDEPYRELVYGDVEVPYLTKYYDNTIVCYSFSKSLSLPGERIGYILVPDEVSESEKLFKAVCGAGRSLGYVCAPSLMQFVVGRCVGHTGDISEYKKNRDLLLEIFDECGFKVAKPDGAFYLFLKAPGGNASAFAERAKKFELLLVPSDSFGFPGYVRVASCVSNDMIRRSIPAFKKLADECL